MQTRYTFFLLALLSYFTTFSQGLYNADLVKMKSMSLNDNESFLSQKKFDFKEVRSSDGKGNDYAFALHLDKYGDFGDEYLVLSYGINDSIPSMVFYQLNKDGWTKLKNTIESLGFTKTRTFADYEGSLTTEYEKSNLIFHFNSGKSLEKNNEGTFVYIIHINSK